VVIQILLALAFAGAGVQKLTMSIADLAPRMSFVQHVPEGLVRFIGAAEVAGALGLLLPFVLRSARWLSLVAAAGLLTIMALAVIFHLSRGELGQGVPAVIFGALCSLLLWIRLRSAPARPPETVVLGDVPLR
jgi:putative oxidoreductase